MQYPNPDVPDPSLPESLRQAVAGGLDAIRAADPGFDLQAFFDAAGDVFTKVKQAWQARDLAPVRGFMGPLVYMTWQGQVEMMLQRGVRNVLDGLTLEVTHVIQAAPGDQLKVRFDYVAHHYALDDRGLTVFDDGTPKPVAEYWLFTRPAGSKTGPSGDGQCPTCGAPYQRGQAACRYCGGALQSAAINGGWVVSEIEELESWKV